MAAIVSAVAVLAVGVALPRLVFGDGTGGYEGEDKNYAELVLLSDGDVREWPFPIDPTVARRVERLTSSPSPDARLCSDYGPRAGPAYTGPFSGGDYSAEVVHYGPFFVPTGKNVFSCAEYRTERFLEPPPGSRLSDPFGFVLLGWILFCLLAVPALPLALLAGGARLWRRGRGWRERVVGLAALGEGAALGLVMLAHLASACS